MSWFFDTPKPFRLRQFAEFDTLTTNATSSLIRRDISSTYPTPSEHNQLPVMIATALVSTFADHSSHPNFVHLAGLVCEAVLEVVFVALPGFLCAWTGMFDANSQKFVAELNTMVFTPCLIFNKLASKLNVDDLGDLVIIPIIFAAQTIVSYLSAQLMARVWGFSKKNKKMQKNFIIAMGVFGNSNSLPISLVMSLSKTIQGLHWDQIPGDNDDEVAARGILYLMIFQQLGQLLRWTWGYSVLLRPASAYEDEERAEDGDEDERGRADRITEEGRYRDESPEGVLVETDDPVKDPRKPTDSGFGSSGSQTPISSASSDSTEDDDLLIPTTPVNPKYIPNASPIARAATEPTRNDDLRRPSADHLTAFPSFTHSSASKDFGSEAGYSRWKLPFLHFYQAMQRTWTRVKSTLSTFFSNIFRALPQPVQKVLSFLNHYHTRFWQGVWRQMNPPLWAMLAALVVASVPNLQHVFFTPGTLVNNSLTRAIAQSGGVAVPLILVVLGANLARSTLPREQIATSPAEKKEERRLLYAALISRMLLPTLVMAPILALIAKFIPVSILDDPIFIIVCFLLTGAPSALQLAQICQINGVFMGAMSNLLVASYVFAIFPSTLTLVLLALEVVEWAVI